MEDPAIHRRTVEHVDVVISKSKQGIDGPIDENTVTPRRTTQLISESPP